MIITKESFKLINFKPLLSSVLELYKANPNVYFGSKCDEILDNIMVQVQLKEINFIEFLTLKMIVRDVYIESVHLVRDYKPNDDTSGVFDLLNKLHTEITSTVDLGNDTSLLSLNFMEFDVRFILTGPSILLFTNGTVENLVMNKSSVKTESEILDFLYDNFPKVFYNFMLKNFDKSDFSSEIVVDDLLYDYIKTKSTPSVTGVRVIGSNDVIQLSGGSNTDVIESLNYMKETNTIYSSRIEFGVFSNMWQFMQFVLYTDYVKTYTPLRNVLGSSTFGFNGDILKDYQIRISNIIRKFIEERQKIITNPGNQLTKYNWLLCSDKIKYKLVIPIKDIPNIDEIINVGDNALSNIKKEIKKTCMILTK